MVAAKDGLAHPRILVVGEGMLELSESTTESWKLGYGGDTLNTAIHLARLGCRVTYATALGTDSFSDMLRDAWRAEGLNTDFIMTDPEHNPGLYAIKNSSEGERSFVYWRAQSAARHMFHHPDHRLIATAAENVDLLLFSLISLAILPSTGREALLELGPKVRASGGRVAFDGNYRPRLWNNVHEAKVARDAAIALCDFGLPTLDDEQALSRRARAEDVAAEWHARGARETVVKLGVAGCLVEGRVISPQRSLKPLDATGAGDAFNAGYLFARLHGKSPASASISGHRLAGWTVMQRGGIPPITPDAPYSELKRVGGS